MVVDVHKGFVVIAVLPLGLAGLALTEINLVAGIVLFGIALVLTQVLWRRYHPDSRSRRW
jgi:hypothetical protein